MARGPERPKKGVGVGGRGREKMIDTRGHGNWRVIGSRVGGCSMRVWVFQRRTV